MMAAKLARMANKQGVGRQGEAPRSASLSAGSLSREAPVARPSVSAPMKATSGALKYWGGEASGGAAAEASWGGEASGTAAESTAGAAQRASVGSGCWWRTSAGSGRCSAVGRATASRQESARLCQVCMADDVTKLCSQPSDS